MSGTPDWLGDSCSAVIGTDLFGCYAYCERTDGMRYALSCKHGHKRSLYLCVDHRVATIDQKDQKLFCRVCEPTHDCEMKTEIQRALDESQANMMEAAREIMERPNLPEWQRQAIREWLDERG